MRQNTEQDITLRSVHSTSIAPTTSAGLLDEQHDAPPPEDDQDGGFRGWLQVFGSFMIFVNIWGFTFIFGIFQSFYELSYLTTESASSISWIGTIQSALLVIIGVVAGPLYDLGVYRWMMISGSALILLGLFMLSLSTEYYQVFLSQGIAVGIGGGLLYVPSLALVSGAFKKKRAMALGVVTCGIGLGGVIYVAAFQSLLPRLGFPWTVRVVAFIALAIFAIAIPTLIINTPAKPSRSSSQSGRQTRKIWDTAALRDAPFLAYSLSSFLIFLGYLVPFFYIPSFAQLILHTTRGFSFWCLAISSAASIAGRLGSALLAQKVLGTMLTWVASGLISALLCFTWIAITHSLGGFIAFCALYGFFSGGLVALPATVFPRICREPKLLGTWMGMGWSLSGVAFLIGAPIAGALTTVGVPEAGQGQEAINFIPVQVWSGLMLALGSVGLCVLWTLLVKMRGEKLLV